MEKDCMVKLTKGQVEQLLGLLDDYIEYGWDGYDTMRGTWNAIFHRMKADDDSIPLYAVAYDKERKKHVVIDVEKNSKNIYELGFKA